MAEQRPSDAPTQSSPDERRTLKRRGILAAAGAVVAGIVAKQTAQPVAAGVDGDVILGMPNTTANDTTITNTVGSSGYALVLHCDNANYGFGLMATGTGYGVFGTGGTYAGVFGDTANSTGSGVTGLARSSMGGIGVSGACDAATGVGVKGASANGTGVMGQASTSGFGVYGVSGSGTGVVGTATTGLGVYGSTSGTGQVAGLYGFSPTAYGIIGNSTASGYSGLTAITSTPNVAALGATSTVPTAYAAFFTGTTIVNGNFAVTGSKSVAAAHPDGTHRLLYCVESPEAWFEDFGEAKLVNGKAEITLDADFAALVDTGSYHVFPVSHDLTNKGLAVHARHPDRFEVGEQGGGTSSGTFSWRVVAKRKENPGKRLEKFVMPKINHPDPDKLPTPEPLKKP